MNKYRHTQMKIMQKKYIKISYEAPKCFITPTAELRLTSTGAASLANAF